MPKKGQFAGRIFETEDVAIIKLIGEGNWSEVYEGQSLARKEKYAIKVISEQKFRDSPKIKELTNAEINILKRCDHKNVIKLYRSFQKQGHLFIVIQYCNGGDLGNLLEKQETLSEKMAIIYLKQILNGMHALHKIRAMHRDFKAQNVMLHDKVCKIVDLGFGKQLKQGENVTRTKLGSNLTMAPEVMQRLPYEFKADIWSIGVVFYQMLEGRFPFSGTNIEAILLKIKNNQLAFKKAELSEESIDFIKKCLVVEPSQRIGWQQIWNHPLLAKRNYLPMVTMEDDDDEENKSKFYSQSYKDNNFKPLNMQQFAYRELRESKRQEQRIEESNIIEQPESPTKNEIKQIGKPISIYQLQQLQSRIAEQNPIKNIGEPFKVKPGEEYFKVNPREQCSQIEQLHGLYNRPHSLHTHRLTEQDLKSFCQLWQIRNIADRYSNIYIEKFNDSSFARLVLLQRKDIRERYPRCNHNLVMALLLKDSYLKITDVLMSSLKDEKNIFRDYLHQYIDYFPCFLYIHKENLLKMFANNCNCLLRIQFQKFNNLLRNSGSRVEAIEEVELHEIASTQNPQWLIYLNNHVDAYWKSLSYQMLKETNPFFKKKLLAYIFSLRTFAIYNRNNKFSYHKLQSILKQFIYTKAEQDIKEIIGFKDNGVGNSRSWRHQDCDPQLYNRNKNNLEYHKDQYQNFRSDQRFNYLQKRRVQDNPRGDKLKTKFTYNLPEDTSRENQLISFRNHNNRIFPNLNPHSINRQLTKSKRKRIQ